MLFRSLLLWDSSVVAGSPACKKNLQGSCRLRWARLEEVLGVPGPPSLGDSVGAGLVYVPHLKRGMWGRGSGQMGAGPHPEHKVSSRVCWPCAWRCRPCELGGELVFHFHVHAWV